MIVTKGIVMLAIVATVFIWMVESKTLDDIVKEYNHENFDDCELLERDVLYKQLGWFKEWCGLPTESMVENGFRSILDDYTGAYPYDAKKQVEKMYDDFKLSLDQVRAEGLTDPSKAIKILKKAVRTLQSLQAKRDKRNGNLDNKVTLFNYYRGMKWYKDHDDILKKYKGLPTVAEIQEGFDRLLSDYPEGHQDEREKIDRARGKLNDELDDAKHATFFADTRQFGVLRRYKHLLRGFQKTKEGLK